MWVIRLVPYWNVNYERDTIEQSALAIRLVPYWNVNTFNYSLSFLYFFIRLVPYWNVNILIGVAVAQLFRELD